MLISCFNSLFSSFSTYLLPCQVAFGATLNPWYHISNRTPAVPYFDPCCPMMPPEPLQPYRCICSNFMYVFVPLPAQESSKSTLNCHCSNVLFLLCQFLLKHDFKTNIINVFEYLSLLFITYVYSICMVVLINKCSLLGGLVYVIALAAASSLFSD